MAFKNSNQSGFSKSFDSGLSKGFKSPGEAVSVNIEKLDNPFRFTPADNSNVSRIKFYDRNSLWTRWRRGYELYTITQSTLGSAEEKRPVIGDYRMYFTYQVFPGIFIPARLFCFPTTNQELKEQIVAVRDANGFNFYNYGLPILAVRYLKSCGVGTYSQSGTTITVSLNNHGLLLGDSAYLSFTSGTGVTSTLTVTSSTTNTFTCTAASPLTTSGNVSVYLSTSFGDNRWTETRVQIRSVFPVISLLTGERIVDRVVERDAGVNGSYSRTGNLVTVNCLQAHGLSTGNSIFAVILGGSVQSRQYVVTVTSTTQLQFSTYDSGVTAGSVVVKRLVMGYDYNDYVGYTLTGVDYTTNELIFQRADSYGAELLNNKPVTVSPAKRGFIVGRFLTTEVRYQCTCQDYVHKNNYNLLESNQNSRFPTTPVSSVKPGSSLNKDNSITPNRDNPGVHTDFGFSATVAGFYDLPDFSDTQNKSYPELYYYQLRWCKHIYATMFSLYHDEGGAIVLGTGTYIQSGPNINITIENHGLTANNKIQINFTSGAALSGEYLISQVMDKNTFRIVYPFLGSATGYCNITNLQRHLFVQAWLLEPNDKPAGDGLDVFYRSFDKQNERTKQAADRLAKMSHGMRWDGAEFIVGAGNLPQEAADYRLREASVLLSDDVRRVGKDFNVSGELLNKTERMADMMSKLFNIPPAQIVSDNFGMLNQPLYYYDSTYQYGVIDGGNYLNGTPFNVVSASTTTPGVITEDPKTVTVLDCLTYDPVQSQEFTVESGLYVS